MEEDVDHDTHDDFEYPASQRHFTHTDLPILSEPASRIIDEHTIDTEAWLGIDGKTRPCH